MKITFKKAKAAVDAVIARAGEDYHYKSHRDDCVYWRDDDGYETVLGCLVGEAFLEMGLDIPSEGAIDDPDIWPPEVVLTTKATTFLHYAQTAQDGSIETPVGPFGPLGPAPFPGGATWGQARDFALSKV